MYFHIYTPLFQLNLTFYFLFFHVQHLLQNGTHLRNFFKNYFTIWIYLCSFGCVSHLSVIFWKSGHC